MIFLVLKIFIHSTVMLGIVHVLIIDLDKSFVNRSDGRICDGRGVEALRKRAVVPW
jgi:hypothetical protein